MDVQEIPPLGWRMATQHGTKQKYALEQENVLGKELYLLSFIFSLPE